MSYLLLEMGLQQTQIPEYKKSVKQGRILLWKMILILEEMHALGYRKPTDQKCIIGLGNSDIAYNNASVSPY